MYWLCQEGIFEFELCIKSHNYEGLFVCVNKIFASNEYSEVRVK